LFGINSINYKTTIASIHQWMQFYLDTAYEPGIVGQSIRACYRYLG
jgi:hypothetical protein